jgi:hypothetical protein
VRDLAAQPRSWLLPFRIRIHPLDIRFEVIFVSLVRGFLDRDIACQWKWDVAG